MKPVGTLSSSIALRRRRWLSEKLSKGTLEMNNFPYSWFRDLLWR